MAQMNLCPGRNRDIDIRNGQVGVGGWGGWGKLGD